MSDIIPPYPGCVSLSLSSAPITDVPDTNKPFPSTLLTGFYATASSAEPLRTDLDNELEG